MRKKWILWQWLSVFLLIFAVFTVPAFSGGLNPIAPPGPTMRSLDQLIPTWDQALSAPERFVWREGSIGVLDRETGLVWEQSPSAETPEWWGAQYICMNRTAGTRNGWRLPTAYELGSLVDTSVPGIPKLPSGHPFSNVGGFFYWSSTTFPWGPGFDLGLGSFTPGPFKWGISFADGLGYLSEMDVPGNVWCVRGGGG